MIQLQVVVTAPLFVAAGWAVYKSLPWWRVVAIPGPVLGTAVSLWWRDTVSSHSKVTDPAINIAVRLAGSLATTLAALLMPGIDRRVDQALDVWAPKKVGGR